MRDLNKSKMMTDMTVQRVPSNPELIVPIAEIVKKLMDRGAYQSCFHDIEEVSMTTAGGALTDRPLTPGVACNRGFLLILSRRIQTVVNVTADVAHPTTYVAWIRYPRDFIWYTTLSMTSVLSAEHVAVENYLIWTTKEVAIRQKSG